MAITVNRDTDIRRYNDATRTDVFTIFTYVHGEPPFERNMISFSETNSVVKNASVLDSALDPLAYPLLFPNGDFGWHVNTYVYRKTGNIILMVDRFEIKLPCYNLHISDLQ